jgi:2-C-methyl-D-erythritol 4-phosphate cytidylyltransferase
MSNTSLILLAGGTGSRMKKDLPKQFLSLAGKPIIMHLLDRLDKIDEINEIIIVCHSAYVDLMKEYIRSYMLQKTYKIVNGGITRQDSVFNGLINASNDNVIIHEAARPFVKTNEFRELIKFDYDNVIFGRKIPFTVVQGKQEITGILERDNLINVQLPQKFNKALLMNCHIKAQEDSLVFTEDASLVYYYCQNPIKVIEGTEFNIKITENIDLLIGEIIYNEYIIGRDM